MMLSLDTPIVIEPTQMLYLFIGLVLLAVATISALTLFLKGYQLNMKFIGYNLTFTNMTISMLGMALGIFFLVMLLMPNYILPVWDVEFWDMAITIGIFAFVVSLISVIFLTYTKRGGF